MNRSLPPRERRRRDSAERAEHTGLRFAMGEFRNENGGEPVQAILVPNKDVIDSLHGSLIAGGHFNSAADLRRGHRFDGVPLLVAGSIDAVRAKKNRLRVLTWPKEIPS